MTSPILTLTTDFGTDSPYVAEIKAAILSINPQAAIVDVTHAIGPQDIRQGAFVLQEVTPRFPPESIHLAVVDPGVGSDRKIVFARIGDRGYVAPDNGLLSALTRHTPATTLIALTNRKYWLAEVSSTFHGRDIMAPVAAHLSLGLSADRLGEPIETLVELDWPEVRIQPGQIEGTVCWIDSFGNLITDIRADMLEGVPSGRWVGIHCHGHQTRGIVPTYSADSDQAAFVALIGSSGRLELAVAGGSAAQTLGVQVGENVTVTW